MRFSDDIREMNFERRWMKRGRFSSVTNRNPISDIRFRTEGGAEELDGLYSKQRFQEQGFGMFLDTPILF